MKDFPKQFIYITFPIESSFADRPSRLNQKSVD